MVKELHWMFHLAPLLAVVLVAGEVHSEPKVTYGLKHSHKIIHVPKMVNEKKVVTVPKVIQQFKLVKTPKFVHEDKLVAVRKKVLVPKLVSVPKLVPVIVPASDEVHLPPHRAYAPRSFIPHPFHAAPMPHHRISPVPVFQMAPLMWIPTWPR